MSLENTAPDRTCYVQCNFCNTILVVNVPSSDIYTTMVTVRCGHCANLLNMSASVQSLPLQFEKQNHGFEDLMTKGSTASSSKVSKFTAVESEQELPRLPPIRPPEKRQRVPSAYNRFIKEEIQRIKGSNPQISHREAFSTAAKNWAHFPHIHFGLKLDNVKNQASADDQQPNSHGFY